MSVTLTSAELKQLEKAIRVLVSPLDYGSVDGWRSTVNRTLKGLLHADSAGFILAGTESLVLYSDDHDQAALARFPDVPPPAHIDGTPLLEGMIKSQVSTNSRWYGEHYHLYTKSVYYNEYSGANRAHDTLYASMSLGGMDARGMASLLCWHERPDGPVFGDREIALLRLLYPAFCAGVDSSVMWRRQAKHLNAAFDWLEHPAIVASSAGQVIHMTASLESLFAEEREKDLLKDAIRIAISELTLSCGVLATRMSGGTNREVRTSTARYRVCAFRFGERVAGTQGYLIAGVTRLSAKLPSADQLKARFRLTPAECGVALLLAQGLKNKQIAARLQVTEHTARRHTEKILQKLQVTTRTLAAAKLLS